jgi:hypothetical protein
MFLMNYFPVRTPYTIFVLKETFPGRYTMAPYRGHVQGGVIVVDSPSRLPEGTHVLIRPERKTLTDPSGVAGSWLDDRSAEEIIKDIRSSRQSKR